MGGEGDVGLLIGARGNSVSDSREAGFKDAMKEDFPGINIVTTQATNWDAAKGSDVAQTVLNKYPDIDGISCVTDPPCLAAMTAAKAAGKNEITWASYDGDFAMHPAIEDGSLKIDVLTGAERVGYWNIALASRILKGSKFPKTVYLPTFFVTLRGDRQGASGRWTRFRVHHPGARPRSRRRTTRSRWGRTRKTRASTRGRRDA